MLLPPNPSSSSALLASRLSPASTSSPIVYKFLCDCGAAYIGRTSRLLAVRSSEHIPKWLREGRSGTCQTAIAEHLLECDCNRASALTRFEVIASCQHGRSMRILEAIFIRRDRPVLCKQKTIELDKQTTRSGVFKLRRHHYRTR